MLTSAGLHMHQLIHEPHPLASLDRHTIILAVTQYFAEHYQESILIPQISRQLGIPLIHIEIAFDSYKGKTASQSLLEYRLNRLCDQMIKNPSSEIIELIGNCGLGSFDPTNTMFIQKFGVDLVEFHQQCFIAAATRLRWNQERGGDQRKEELIGEHKPNRLLTRFHQTP
jgi:AraC-like DNA-binding protein